MRLNIVGKHTAPLPPYDCELYCFEVQSIPSILWSMWLKQQKYFWKTPEDAERGRTLLTNAAIGMLMPCGNEIGYKVDRLARIVDSALYGRSYTATGELDENGLPIVTPALSDSVSPESALTESMYTNSRVSRLLLKNITDGSATSETVETRNFRQQLEDIRALIEQMNTEDVDYTPLLQAIAALLA